MAAPHPTRVASAIFALKASAFRAKRALEDARGAARRWPLASGASAHVVAEIVSPLRPNASEPDPREAHLIAGKIENLRVAVRRIDGAVVPAGGTFSFWRQVGRATASRGYVEGRELREGCIVPSIGGGLCQLSNALYGAALDAGCEIVERHAHSQIVPGSAGERDRDATVFWNYVDLRFRPRRDLAIRAHLESDRLVVRFCEPTATRVLGSPRPARAVEPARAREESPARSCASCEVESCGRHRPAAVAHVERSAYLVDAYWPEFDAYVRARATREDMLCVPLDGRRLRLARYGWDTTAFAEVRQAPRQTLERALRTRGAAANGAARQRALLRSAERLARHYARALTPAVEHVVVAQNLLPFLWRSGALGGRTFDVLLTGPPLRALQATLDAAARLHPESPTLADFRADAALLDAESAALARARAIVTPHPELARTFGARARLLDWSEPASPQRSFVRARNDAGAVLFPASTLGRAGAYEVREAARRLGFPLVVTGAAGLEGPDFWRGVDVRFEPEFEAALAATHVAVLPAFVESRPRRLLAALAAEIPVIATAACGLGRRENVTTVAPGDADALTLALAARLRDAAVAAPPAFSSRS